VSFYPLCSSFSGKFEGERPGLADFCVIQVFPQAAAGGINPKICLGETLMNLLHSAKNTGDLKKNKKNHCRDGLKQ
jgi:hypothetical protein